jgi:hypothetical protein
MWEILPSSQYEKDRKWYNKKRPNELAAVLNNLDRYMEQLNIAPNSRSVKAGYLHDEQRGVVALDQRPVPHIQVTRLYTFADDDTRELHLITIGNKDTQPNDVKVSADFVDDLLASKS